MRKPFLDAHSNPLVVPFPNNVQPVVQPEVGPEPFGLPNGAVKSLCDSISIASTRRKLTGLHGVHMSA